MKKVLMIITICLLPIISFSASVEYTLTDVNYPIMVNGEVLQSEVPAMNYQGTTMLPLKAVSEALDIDIGWTGSEVEITTADPEEIAKSCVMVNSKKGQGSGVLIGYNEILTCNHVINEGDEFTAKYDNGYEVDCFVYMSTYYPDMAILQPSKTDVKPVKIGDTDELKIGDKVFSISCPNARQNIIKWGKVTSVVNDKDGEMYTFEFDGVTSAGSSGGAVFNTKGELVGLIQSGETDNMTAISINCIRKSLTN